MDFHLSQSIKEHVELDSLNFESATFVDDELRLSMCDVVYSIDISNGSQGFIVILLEHQSTPQKDMPFRILKYIVRIMDYYSKQDDADPDKPYPFVHPIVFYHGKSPYPYSIDLKDLINAPENLIKNQWEFTFQLIDLHEITDIELRNNSWAGVVDFVFKHIRARKFLKYFNILIKMLNKLEGRNSTNLTQILLKYVEVTAEIDKIDFIEVVNTEISKNVRGDVMTVVEQAKQEGIEQGKFEIALNMLKLDADEEFVAKATQLSKQQIKNLKDQLNTDD